MSLQDVLDERIASSTEFDSVTNKNRPKSRRGPIYYPSGQRRDLIDDGQISGKDLRSLKTMVVDIGAETPFDHLSIQGGTLNGASP
jgi:hypothetical protein